MVNKTINVVIGSLWEKFVEYVESASKWWSNVISDSYARAILYSVDIYCKHCAYIYIYIYIVINEKITLEKMERNSLNGSGPRCLDVQELHMHTWILNISLSIDL